MCTEIVNAVVRLISKIEFGNEFNYLLDKFPFIGISNKLIKYFKTAWFIK